MVQKVSISRYHDISCGHRVVGHESKCKGLHGHNYRIHFECAGELDALGRVIDFSVVKGRLCNWLEDYWDHKMILWDADPFAQLILQDTDREQSETHCLSSALWKEVCALGDKLSIIEAMSSIVRVPFNPTAENMALHLLHRIAPQQLRDTGVYCRKVIVEETRKCSAYAELN